MGPVLGAVGKFIAAIFIGTSAGGAYALAVNVARLGLLAVTAKLSAPKLDLTEQAVTKALTIRDPIAPQKFIYGEDMVSGPLNFANVAGTDNSQLFLVVNMVGHECDSVVGYRVDDTDVPLTDLSGAEEGNFIGGKFNGVGRIDRKLGTLTQTLDNQLDTHFPTLFQTNHTGRGWAYCIFRFDLIEGSEDVFKTQPQNVRTTWRGKKVYDPRLDDTNGGSGPHRLADSSTWEWSDNSALCLADYIRDDKFGMREEDDRVNWPKVITAADICDELVTVPPASPTTTQNRYTCNATFNSTQARGEVKDELLNSMLGRMIFSQGQWHMWAGAAITPDVTLTEANLRGSIQLEASTPSRDRYNRVRGKFIDASRNYVASQYPEQRSSTFETEDGGELLEEVADFLSCNNDFEAQRKAIITLKKSRNQRVLVFVGNFSCFRIQPGTTVLLTIAELGFAGEKFFVTEWKLTPDGVDLTMVRRTTRLERSGCRRLHSALSHRRADFCRPRCAGTDLLLRHAVGDRGISADVDESAGVDLRCDRGLGV